MTGLVQAHWVRPNEVTRQPKCWVYLDTEARIIERDGHQWQRWRLGVTCHDHRRGPYDDWRPEEWAIHATPLDLWSWVNDRAKVSERCVVIAHNLAYDLRIADAFRVLPTLGWVLDRVRLDAEQTQVRWRDGKRTLLMIDSTAWWPVALDTLGTEMGITKPALPTSDSPDAEWVDRCVTDVRILREAWRRCLTWLHDDDLGNWQPTGAGQGWAVWRHRFMTDRVLVGDDPTVRALEREAVWSGRSEAWRHGAHIDGPYTEWDLQSAYLAIMRDADLPVRQVAHVEHPHPKQVTHWRQTGRVLARVEVDTDTPVVPAAGPHGTRWPVGQFTTTVWDPELELLDAVGAKYRVVECCVYQRRPALRAFAEWLWPLATNASHDIDPIVHRTAKHWSRSLIGRFGVRYHVWEPYGPTPTNQVGLQTVTDTTDGTTWRLLSIGDRCLREGDQLEGENAVPSIMGWVMSELRARLWAAMNVAGLDHVLHVDTDGLLVDLDGSARILAAGVAGLRIKGMWRNVEVIAPRQVVYGETIRAPGVPKRARRVAPHTWEGESWQWLSSSLREGHPDTVRVSRRRVTLHAVDTRRQHLDGGATAPFTEEPK